jgi:ATP-dependent Clp protease ATP-binding subunit ClpB
MSTWSQVLTRIEQIVDRTEYDTWLAPTRFLGQKGDTLDVAVPSQRYVDEIRERFGAQIRGLLKRLEDRKIHVELTDAARNFIVTEGYDPMYGARPLKRTIQRRVLDPLAMRVLEGEFREGQRVVVDVGDNGIRFEKTTPVAA